MSFEGSFQPGTAKPQLLILMLGRAWVTPIPFPRIGIWKASETARRAQPHH